MVEQQGCFQASGYDSKHLSILEDALKASSCPCCHPRASLGDGSYSIPLAYQISPPLSPACHTTFAGLCLYPIASSTPPHCHVHLLHHFQCSPPSTSHGPLWCCPRCLGH